MRVAWRMKRFWWSWLLVFVLGFGAGSVGMGEKDPVGTQPPSFSLPPTRPEASVPSVEATRPEFISGQLPCRIPYTNLIVRRLAAYDGPYLEDGTEEELVGIAALVLENTSTIGIEYVQVVVSQGGQELTFDATYLPPRSKVLILEKNRAAYSDRPIEGCRCRTLIPGTYDWEKDQVAVGQGEGFSMTVTNLTDRTLPFVRVFYKQHDGAADLHIGGITLSAVIPDLLPGETRTIMPYRYAGDYSAVVAVVVDS